MIKKYKIPTVFFVLIIMIASCREVYLPDEIRSLGQTPIIRGIICEGSSPAVSVNYAMGYYENTEIPVSDATVVITDNLGNQVELLEESAGSYKPVSDDFKGVIGRVYKLHVNTPDGNDYESDAVMITERPVIDSIYARVGEMGVILYNTDGEPVTKANIQEGFYLFTDLSAETDSTVYYRFSTSVIKLFCYTMPGIVAVTYYIWESPVVINDFYSVDFTIGNNGRQILPEYEMSYVQWTFLKNLPTEAICPTTCYVLILKAYAISAGVYDYYHSIDRQLNSDNQMFAPVPSQIKTNIHCVNDPAGSVSGVFEASSMVVGYKAFLYLNKDSFRSRTLTFFPDTFGSGFFASPVETPDFWVNFYEDN